MKNVFIIILMLLLLMKSWKWHWLHQGQLLKRSEIILLDLEIIQVFITSTTTKDRKSVCLLKDSGIPSGDFQLYKPLLFSLNPTVSSVASLRGAWLYPSQTHRCWQANSLTSVVGSKHIYFTHNCTKRSNYQAPHCRPIHQQFAEHYQ